MNKLLSLALPVVLSTFLMGCGSEDEALYTLIDEPLELNTTIETLHLTWDQSLYSKISQNLNDGLELNDSSHELSDAMLLNSGQLTTVANGYPVAYFRNGVSVYEFINVTMDDFNSFTTKVSEHGVCIENLEINLSSVRCIFDDRLAKNKL